jgi:hypothetical protein
MKISSLAFGTRIALINLVTKPLAPDRGVLSVMISTSQRDIFVSTRSDARPIRFFSQAARRALHGCELNAVLDETLKRLSAQYPNKFIAPTVEGPLHVRVPKEVLERVIGLMFEGMAATGLWNDGNESCVCPVICKCLQGYGAVLELTEERAALPSKLLYNFAQPDAVESPDMPGRQWLKARDLIERHGGRLHLTSPLYEQGAGVSLKLFLPLTPRSSPSVIVDAGRKELFEALV